jgi:hypothetical protein
MGEADLAGLRAWFDEQAAVVRASVTEPPTPEPTPTEPTPSEPTPTGTVPTSSPTKPIGNGPIEPDRLMRRDAGSALAELEALLTDALDAEAVSADVELSR